MISIEILRSFRIAGYAVFDFIISFVGIYLLAPLMSKLFAYIHIDISRKSWLFLTLPLAVLIHLIFGEMTPMTAGFIDIHSHWLEKIGILLLFILGIKDITIKKKK